VLARFYLCVGLNLPSRCRLQWSSPSCPHILLPSSPHYQTTHPLCPPPDTTHTDHVLTLDTTHTVHVLPLAQYMLFMSSPDTTHAVQGERAVFMPVSRRDGGFCAKKSLWQKQPTSFTTAPIRFTTAPISFTTASHQFHNSTPSASQQHPYHFLNSTPTSFTTAFTTAPHQFHNSTPNPFVGSVFLFSFSATAIRSTPCAACLPSEPGWGARALGYSLSTRRHFHEASPGPGHVTAPQQSSALRLSTTTHHTTSAVHQNTTPHHTTPHHISGSAETSKSGSAEASKS
jgi:hypothetical protein